MRNKRKMLSPWPLPTVISCLQLQRCCCLKGAAGALRAAPPPPAPDNGLSRALLLKAKFVICHFSYGCFSSWLLTKWPKKMPRCQAASLAGGRVRGLGVSRSNACVTIARKMLQECSAVWVPARSRWRLRLLLIKWNSRRRNKSH